MNNLSREQLQQIAPSIFAPSAASNRSEKYAFIPTFEIVDALIAEGFMPVRAEQSRTRIPGMKNFTQHVIRFRHQSVDLAQVGIKGEVLELGLRNSHNGASVYELFAGIFRVACLNGLTISTALLASIKVRHIGSETVRQVLEGSKQILTEAPKVFDTVNRWKTITLAPQEALALATTAHSLRYEQGTPMAQVVTPEKLLTVHRSEDEAPTLWNVHNVIEENLIARGGIKGRVDGANTYRGFRRVKSRPVKGISENIKLERALWDLSTRMAELKSA